MSQTHRPVPSREPSRSHPRGLAATVLGTGVLAGVLALTGCATPSVHERPAVTVPERFSQDPGDASQQSASVDASVAAGLSSWWRAIGDEALSGLIDEAIRRNNDLAQAAIRVRRAQLVAGQAASDRLPELSLRTSSTATRALDGGPTARLNSVTAGVSWELDLWGRLASLNNAADWEAQATEQYRQAAALALVGTTANLHWQVAYLNQRVLASQQSIDHARRTLELVQAQYRTGAVSGLEVAQATQALASQEAAHTQFVLQRTQARNALAILFDRPPGALPNESQRLPDGALPEVPPGVPADLLVRRPDLRAAELRLRKTLAQVDATRRSFYPALTLTGSLGGSSSALSQVLADPVTTLGAGLVLPFVQWRDMQRNVAISEVDHELAVVGFRQSWYAALSDVDNALASRQQLERQGQSLQAALDAALASERLSEARYRAGAVPLKTWLDAQEARRQTENSLALNRLNRLNALVTLYQSLGGGMEG